MYTAVHRAGRHAGCVLPCIPGYMPPTMVGCVPPCIPGIYASLVGILPTHPGYTHPMYTSWTALAMRGFTLLVRK